MKKTIVILEAAALTLGSLSMPTPAIASDKDEKAAAIVGIIALGLLGAAAASHQHEQGHEEYRHHPRLHKDENAVGACMHHAKRLVKRAGGHHTRLNRVDRINHRNNGSTVVVFHATGYYDFGRKMSKIRCVVRNHKIAKFDYT